MLLIYVLGGYLFILNAYTFMLMGVDKRRATRRESRRRVPEKHFFTAAFIGGAAGVWAGMKWWRHKTQHRAFSVGIPYLLAIHLILLIVLGWLLAKNTSS